jgi:pimeloyl-ACP methyl ester carboxylesterase
VTLVGNDSGGAISQVVAAEHPERLGRLVLTSCDCFDNSPPKLFRPLVPLSRVPGALGLAFRPLRMRAPRRLPFAYGWLTRGPLPHERIDRWVQAFYADRGVRRDTEKVTRGLRPEVMLETAAKLARFDRPALLAFAADDKLFPPEHGERLAAILPRGRSVPVENSRTWVMLDQPDRLVALIQAFVAEGSQSAGSTPAGVAPGAAAR